MTEHPNAVLMQRAFRAFGAADFDALSELIAEDAAWHQPGTSQISGDYQGRAGVFGFFRKMFELSGGTFKVEVIDILADDERVVAIEHATAARDGRHLDTRDVVVTEIRDGKFTGMTLYAADEKLEDAFWS